MGLPFFMSAGKNPAFNFTENPTWLENMSIPSKT